MGLMQTYSFFRHHFSGVDELKQQVVKLEKEIEQERLKSHIAYYEAETIRQDMAALLPDKIKSKKDSYQIRGLASVLQIQEPIKFDSSKKVLSEGKELFANTRYNESIATFKKLIDQYPESSAVVEAYFLLAESYYQIQAVEDTIDTIETMVSLFPESELTGFALLRLSGIFIERNLSEDAQQVLFTVKHNFAFNPDLVLQAEKMLKKVEP